MEPAGEAQRVLATVLSYEGHSETIDAAAQERFADEVFLASPAGAAALACLDEEWATWDAMHEGQN